MDSSIILLTVVGAAILAAAILPGLLTRVPISLPMVYVGVGALLFWLPLGLEGPRPVGQGFVALGATLVVYGVCELLHGYRFLTVFIAAVVIRRTESNHSYLAHAVNIERFPRAAEVWAVAIAAILTSIVIHGASATAVFAALDRRLDDRAVRRRRRRTVPT